MLTGFRIIVKFLTFINNKIPAKTSTNEKIFNYSKSGYNSDIDF